MANQENVKYKYHGSNNIWSQSMTPHQKKKHKKIFGGFVTYIK